MIDLLRKLKTNPAVQSLYNQRVIIAFIVALLTLIVVGLFAFRTVLQLSEDYGKVVHTYSVIGRLDKIAAATSYGQTELRAYYLTSDPTYLQRYHSMYDSIKDQMSALNGKLFNNQSQTQLLRSLEQIIEEREDFNNSKIEIFRKSGMAAAEKKYPLKKSQGIAHRIDSVIYVMESAEKQMLAQGAVRTADQTNRTLLLISFGGLVSVILLLVVFLFLTREIQQRAKVEKEIRDSEQRFNGFLETVPAGIFILNADGKPFYANNEAKKILGAGIVPHASPDNLSETYNAYIQGTDKPYPSELIPIVRALKGERTTISDIEIWKPDAIIPLLVTGAPIYDSTGNLQYAMAAFIDISEQKRAEQQLVESEERYRQIIENASDIIFRTDREGKLTYVNPIGLRVFGYTEQEAIGMHYLEVIRAEEIETVKRFYLRQAVTKTQQTYYEFNAITKYGKQIVLGQNVQLLMNNDRMTGFLAVSRDISEKKRYEIELTEAKETAESATLAKSQFLATMSHEIRTPMNGVIGMTDLLLQTTLNDEQREYTEIIRTSGETLLTLINDILDFSKIESGKLDMEKRPVEIQNLVEETFDLVARRAVEKRLDLVYLIDQSVPPYIIGDAVRLRQILLNLVNNAIKFTEKGEVYLSVKEAQHEGDGTTLHFSIKDTGIGIPKEQLNKLFLVFSQVDASTTRKYGGTGLGLAITKRLVELMDGTLWVDSEEGKGSTFHFTIKVPTTSSADTLPKKYVRGKIPELQGKRVLLVDDNETNLNILSIQCSNWGMHPRATTSHKEAMQWLKGNDPFDLAIVDFHMPEIDGVELARAIRGLRNEQSLPIVLFSSSGRSEFSETENKLFAAVILKPLKQSHLYSTMIDVYSKGSNVQLAHADPLREKIESISESIPLKILVAEDNLINQKLALRLLQQLGYSADIASNGKEALAMIRQYQYDIVFMDLHMPVMDGLETTKEIVNTMTTSIRPKIIAMTADAMSGDREKCIDAGMDDYISKPVRLNGLRDTLQQYGTMILERKNLNGGVHSETDGMFMRLKELLNETDKDFFLEFVQSLPTQSEEIMKQVQTAWDEKNIKQLVFASHKLRGLALSYGANILAEYCKVIEHNAETNPDVVTGQSILDVERSLRQSFVLLSDTISKLGVA